MSKKQHEPELTEEQQKLAAEMQADFEKLAQAEKKANPNPNLDPDLDPGPKATVEDYAEGEPARFRTGGAPYSEIAAWREVHGTPAGVAVEGVVPLGAANPE